METVPEPSDRRALQQESLVSGREAASRFNLRLIYYIWALFRAMDTLSYGPFFDLYLSELTSGGATFVGWVETVNSMTQVMIAFPLGMFADKHRRSSVMRCNACLGIVALLCYWPAIFSGSRVLLFVAVVAYAVYSRSYGGTMDMMMADAVTPATSTHVATRKTQMGTMGSAMGPILQMALLLSGLLPEQSSHPSGLGELGSNSDWSTDQLKWLVAGGWLVFPLIAPAQCSFKELQLQPSPGPIAPESSADVASETPHDGRETRAEAAVTPVRSDSCRSVSPSPSGRPWWVLPVLLEGFRMATLMCTGLCTRFFALLFKNLYHMTPVGVAVLYAASPLSQTLALQAVPAITNRCGRPAAVLILHLLSCVALLALSVAEGPWAAAAAFLVYQAIVKISNIPVYSLVLDSVKPEHRGKFFHLLSIKPLTFGGSALLGGYIADAFGYRVP